MIYDNWLNLLNYNSSFYKKGSAIDKSWFEGVAIISCTNTDTQYKYFKAFQQSWKKSGVIVIVLMIKDTKNSNITAEIMIYENFHIFKKFNSEEISKLKKGELKTTFTKNSNYKKIITSVIRLN